MSRRRTSEGHTEQEPSRKDARRDTRHPQPELPGADDDPEQAPLQEQKEREQLKQLRRERQS